MAVQDPPVVVDGTADISQNASTLAIPSVTVNSGERLLVFSVARDPLITLASSTLTYGSLSLIDPSVSQIVLNDLFLNQVAMVILMTRNAQLSDTRTLTLGVDINANRLMLGWATVSGTDPTVPLINSGSNVILGASRQEIDARVSVSGSLLFGCHYATSNRPITHDFPDVQWNVTQGQNRFSLQHAISSSDPTVVGYSVDNSFLVDSVNAFVVGSKPIGFEQVSSVATETRSRLRSRRR